MLKKVFALFIISLVFVCFKQPLSVGPKIKKDCVVFSINKDTLAVYPLADNAVRIQFYNKADSGLPEFVFTKANPVPWFKVEESGKGILIKLKKLFVEINRETGSLTYFDTCGKVILQEKEGSRVLIPNSEIGKPCSIVEQSFESPADEYIFGLGQFQDGHYNIKGITRRLTQVNTQISIPFIYSGKGYGLLWNQYGLTDYNPANNFITLDKQEQLVGNNKLAEVTTTSGTQKVLQNQSLYKGKFTVPKDGTYSIFLDLENMGNIHYVVIDGKACIDQTNMWLPPTVGTFVDLKAGEHVVFLVCKSDNNPKLSWKIKENCTSFRSPHANKLDYVVFSGNADEVIATYRNLTGQAPMFPLWAYGFWQCRERYTSGKHLVETVREFRKRKLPMDVIVQDWQYWGSRGWGVPQFDTLNYPNPSGFIKEIHDLNAHFNISIWSNPDKNSNIGKEYVAKNLFIPETKWLDYFNPDTRREYWGTLNNNLFKYGVDSWWMDATEPENDALNGKNTCLGPGNFYRLTYPLMVSKAVYDGQRETTNEKRVCILTRSAFSGQQRYGIINWSGDIGGTWDAYRRQIVAGLNYSITGMPYWTTDIGGFFRPGKQQYTDPKYHELLIRWFQWGAFNPVFRSHGYRTETEPWKFGQSVEDKIRKILNLRYQLLPYIYSEAWQITNSGSSMMRPMVMDFNYDGEAVNQSCQYMFGKSFLVAPVTVSGVDKWKVYLPKQIDWFDFWTGKPIKGGQFIETNASLDIIPLFVKAGSIVPMGKNIQFSGEKIADTLEIRVYAGANGSFQLYEDEGDNYNYEKGIYSIIPFEWDDKNRILTVGERQGKFTVYLEKRILKIVHVSEKGGYSLGSSNVNKTIIYTGEKVKLKI
jgi:alpha-D-xyloside xylohydrolase